MAVTTSSPSRQEISEAKEWKTHHQEVGKREARCGGWENRKVQEANGVFQGLIGPAGLVGGNQSSHFPFGVALMG